MLETSMELNKALKELVSLYESLGKVEEPKVCNMSVENRIKTSIDFLKVYEICVRTDESLRDAIRHHQGKEIKQSLDRVKVLINELVDVISDFPEEEKRLLHGFIQSDFDIYYKQLGNILKKRPSERIWEDEKLVSISTDLSHAMESLRKSAGKGLLAVATSMEGSSNYFGRLVC